MNPYANVAAELFKALAWPLVGALAVYLLRRPLLEVLSQFARRARKVSVAGVSVELATLPELHASWTMGSVDPRQLTSSQVFDSASQTLFEELLRPRQADYALVDLGTGQRWLTSRLFIFAVILGEVTGLRAFAFVETNGGVRRKYLGTATPADVWRALATHYPWLEEAFARAMAGQAGGIPVATPPMSKFSNQPYPFTPAGRWKGTGLGPAFVDALHRTTEPPGGE